MRMAGSDDWRTNDAVREILVKYGYLEDPLHETKRPMIHFLDGLEQQWIPEWDKAPFDQKRKVFNFIKKVQDEKEWITNEKNSAEIINNNFMPHWMKRSKDLQNDISLPVSDSDDDCDKWN